ncbi:head-tail adaptor protein [Tropicimonas sp. IMCC34043]|uniref:head-tail adaptor protein n=1 Tax=Tropicimonas sp. IMCC34043 TaxID=2248760 RepID=UPI000E24C4AE|nr:head-tail adaptor protein [Tropicimonas sp. IMCC34043]
MSGSDPVLNRKLVLETPVPVSDGAGGARQNWSSLGVVWAEVRASSGREAEEGAVAVSSGAYQITVRAAPPGRLNRPRPDQRFRENERVFRILAVVETGTDGRFLTCFAREEEIAP